MRYVSNKWAMVEIYRQQTGNGVICEYQTGNCNNIWEKMGNCEIRRATAGQSWQYVSNKQAMVATYRQWTSNGGDMLATNRQLWQYMRKKWAILKIWGPELGYHDNKWATCRLDTKNWQQLYCKGNRRAMVAIHGQQTGIGGNTWIANWQWWYYMNNRDNTWAINRQWWLCMAAKGQ